MTRTELARNIADLAVKLEQNPLDSWLKMQFSSLVREYREMGYPELPECSSV